MALKGVKPEAIKKRLKVLFYGAPGVGKTTAAIQFPSPYLIDTEKGAENDSYVKELQKSNGVIFQTSDFEEIVTEIKELLTVKHDFRTLVIDPLTTPYNDLIEKSEKKVGTDFGRHFNEANKRIKHLYNQLMRLDMNVIVTCHSKDKYGDNMSIVGTTFDCYKKLDYMFDLVLEIQKRGGQRFAVIRKSRLEEFKEGDSFPHSYEEIAKRYGGDILEKKAVVEKLASKDQVILLKHLVELYKEPIEVVDKWKEKAKVESFEEMNEEIIDKIIKHMESKGKVKSLKDQWIETETNQ
jgi:broad-specificity NMP kinase